MCNQIVLYPCGITVCLQRQVYVVMVGLRAQELQPCFNNLHSVESTLEVVGFTVVHEDEGLCLSRPFNS